MVHRHIIGKVVPYITRTQNRKTQTDNMDTFTQVQALILEKPPSSRIRAVRSLSNLSQRLVQRVSSNLRSGTTDIDANDSESSSSGSRSGSESENGNGVSSAISFFERVAREVGIGAPKLTARQQPRASYSAPTSTIHTPSPSPNLSPVASPPTPQSPDLATSRSLNGLLEHQTNARRMEDPEIKPCNTPGSPTFSDPTRRDSVPLRYSMVASHSDPHLPRLRKGSEGDFRTRRGSRVQLGGSVVEGVPRSGSLPFGKKGKSPSRETVVNMNGVIVEKERQGSFDATSSPAYSPGHSRSGSVNGPNSPTFQALIDNFWPQSLRRSSNRSNMESQSLESLTPASFAISSKGGEKVGMIDLRAAESEEESFRVRERENRLASPNQSPVLGKWVNRSEVMHTERTQMIGALSRPDRCEEEDDDGD